MPWRIAAVSIALVFVTVALALYFIHQPLAQGAAPRLDQSQNVSESGIVESLVRRLDLAMIAVALVCLTTLIVGITIATKEANTLLDQLRKRESELRAIVQNIPNGIIGTDQSGTITLVNAKVESMFGYSRDELIGQSVEVLLPESQRAEHAADRDEFHQHSSFRGMTKCSELYGVHQSGALLPVDIDQTPIEPDAANLLGTSVLASVVDASARRAREKENERLRIQTQKILDFIPAVILFKDTKNHLLRVNIAAAKMMNIKSTKDAEGSHASDFFDEHAKSYADDQEVMKTRQPRMGLLEREILPNGAQKWTSSDKIPVIDDDGMTIGIITVIHDITPLKRAEESLRRANDDLRHSNEELAQFAYLASHDLQEPLRKVTSYSELLQQELGDSLNKECQQFLHYIVDGATRMRTLIQDLLTISKIDSQPGNVGTVDVNHVVRIVMGNLAVAIDESDAKVTVGELPIVQADSTRLTQLFQNLIGNAIKYGGDEKPCIEIQAKSNASHWEFSIADNGIGIEPQYFEQIFGVFKRLHSADQYPGTGIGLAICKRIVDRMSGKIWVESTAGQGSTFRFTLPKLCNGNRQYF